MGWLDATQIEKAGAYLLSVLQRERRVAYSMFYDGSDERHQRLCEETRLDDWYGPEGVVDEAAYQLEAMGFVTILKLDAELSDGEPDYQIELTDVGRTKLEGGFRPEFGSVDL